MLEQNVSRFMYAILMIIIGAIVTYTINWIFNGGISKFDDKKENKKGMDENMKDYQDRRRKKMVIIDSFEIKFPD